MEATIGNAALLMMIGMISVLSVLLIVVLGGRMLIHTVNKFASDPNTLQSSVNTRSQREKEGIDKQTMAVLAATVSHVTGGRGGITSVQKL